jgi:hypothetical protein
VENPAGPDTLSPGRNPVPATRGGGTCPVAAAAALRADLLMPAGGGADGGRGMPGVSGVSGAREKLVMIISATQNK